MTTKICLIYQDFIAAKFLMNILNKLELIISKKLNIFLSCVVLGSFLFCKIILEGYLSSVIFHIYEIQCCTNCGYKMQNPRFQKDFYIEYYNHLYRKIAF